MNFSLSLSTLLHGFTFRICFAIQQCRLYWFLPMKMMLFQFQIALRLHHTTLGGRKINVEFTSIGGGKSQERKDKLKLKNLSRAKMKMPFDA